MQQAYREINSSIYFDSIRVGDATSHPTLVQLVELIMTLVQHFVPEEMVVKSVIEVVLDL